MRRSNPKSRFGCKACKAKKIKCDEVQPTCGKCARQGSYCSFNDDPSSIIFVPGLRNRQSRQIQEQRQRQPPGPSLPPRAAPPVAEDGVGGESSSAGPHTVAASSPSTPTNASPSDHRRGNDFDLILHPVSEEQSFTPLERDNLYLMRYYLTTASSDMISGHSQESLWTNIVLDLAFKHNYLLHAILAISALHLALTNAQENRDSAPNAAGLTASSLAALARHHHSHFVPPFRAQLSRMDTSLLPTLFTGAAILGAYAFGYQIIVDPHISEPIPSIYTALSLLRGTSAVVQAGPEVFQSGPFSALMLPKPADPPPILPQGLLNALSRLESRCLSQASPSSPERQEGLVLGYAERAPYLTAMAVLRHCFTIWFSVPGTQGTVVSFAIMVPEEVLFGIRDERPLAVCILAIYAVLMLWLEDLIWLGPWGRRVIEGVSSALGNECRAELEWPLEQLRRGRFVPESEPSSEKRTS